MSLVIDVAARRGDFETDVAFEVAAGEVVGLVGPNGAGKSTLLRLVAGLEQPDRGAITLDGRTLVDAGTGTHLPIEERRVGIVFQDYLLFGNLSVLENVAFGPRSQGTSRASARALAERWLSSVGLSSHASQKPGTLSGGQQQRVALARALASEPDCLLLDEPLSALDADSRGTIRRELRRHLAEFAGPVLLVTHEPLEALALADRLVVLEGGRVTQSGSAAEVARHPRSEWVARLVGVNLVRGTKQGHEVTVDGGGLVVVAGDAPDGPVLLTVHPRSISLHRTRPEGSPRNVWEGVVQELEVAGDRARVQVAGVLPLNAEVTVGALAELRLDVGDAVWVAFKASEVAVYAR